MQTTAAPKRKCKASQGRGGVEVEGERGAEQEGARRHEAECDGGGDRGEQHGGRGGEALGQVVCVLEHGGDAEPDGRIVKDDQAA